MTREPLITLSLALLAAIAFASDGTRYQAKPQPLARSLSAAQIDKAVAAAPADANVGVPAWYAHQTAAFRPIATNALAVAAVPALGLVIEDTRANIPEVAGLTDVEIAQLYLAQMVKPAEELQALAPTNSLEYLIGAGIRADILKAREASR